MRRLAALLLVLSTPAAAATERWLLVTDLWGNAAYQALVLERSGQAVAGRLGEDVLTGEMQGNTLRFTTIDSDGRRSTFTGIVGGAAMQGSADMPDTNDAKARVQHGFTARRLPDRPPGPPRKHDFAPHDYANIFDPHRAPVLTIWPGDSVRTSTVDSGGVDAQGVTRALFGNPQTGPFFVMGAEPGDTLAIHIIRLTLNRDWADSLDSIVGRAQTPALAARAGDLGKPIRWQLDRVHGTATPASGGRLAGFRVPVRPMLGGLAVAPGFGSPALSTGDTARSGGNMDFPEVVAGNTVYLPVQQPGALLYLGDGHALQGDGETSQYALETSLDVEFSVDVIKGKAIGLPRVESPTQVMVLGQAGSLDDALRAATAGLVQWLEADYGVSLSEAAQILGSSVHYSVPNLAGRSVGVAAKLDKDRLAFLARRR